MIAAIKHAWTHLHPVWVGMIGSTVIVCGGLLSAILLDIFDGTASDWWAMRKLLIFAWVLGTLVCTAITYKLPPEVTALIERLRK